jgi:hypothetical protein
MQNAMAASAFLNVIWTASECLTTIADHVVPHKGDWNDFRLGELQSLCKQCHDSTKQLIERRGYSYETGTDGLS